MTDGGAALSNTLPFDRSTTLSENEMTVTALSLTDSTFGAEVLRSAVPVLVDFWAPWCGPCRMMSRNVDEVSAELGDRARVVKVNIDEAPATAVRYGITSIPSFAVIFGGEVQQRFSGLLPKARHLGALKPLLV
jgi:thioredoxin 1